MRASYKQRVLRDLSQSRDNEHRLAHVIHELVNNAVDLGHEVVAPDAGQWSDAASFAEQRLRLVRLADVNALQRELEDLRAKLAAAEAKLADAVANKPSDGRIEYRAGVLMNPRAEFDRLVDQFAGTGELTRAVNTTFGLKKTEEQIRRETLKKIIDALNLDAYRDSEIRFFGLLGANPQSGADRFWSDINTTLRVRDERAHAEANEAAAARIDALSPRETRDKWDTAGETILSGDENGIDE